MQRKPFYLIGRLKKGVSIAMAFNVAVVSDKTAQ
jgi:hypothetical protein